MKYFRLQFAIAQEYVIQKLHQKIISTLQVSSAKLTKLLKRALNMRIWEKYS